MKLLNRIISGHFKVFGVIHVFTHVMISKRYFSVLILINSLTHFLVVMDDVLKIPVDDNKHVNAVIRFPKDTSTWTNFGVIITHGAGGDMNSKALMNFVNTLTAAGFITIRFTCKPPNFTYRVKCYTAVFEHCKENISVQGFVLAGRSMGARVAAQVASNKTGDSCIYGVACISYPLHAAGKLNELRTSHLLGLTRPVFIMNGTKDEMCQKELMDDVLSSMACTVTMHWVANENHSLSFGKNEEMKTNMCKLLIRWCQSVFSLELS